MSITPKPARCWLDLETTHLDKRIGSIIEIAVVLADAQHNPLAEYSSAICPEEGNRWSEWSLKHHTASGLFDESLRARPLAVVFTDLDLWLSHALAEPVPLAGCSVHRFDAAWIDWHVWAFGLPDIMRHFNHRYFDISTLLAEAADVGDPIPESDPAPHRALADCRRALATARALRQQRRLR